MECVDPRLLPKWDEMVGRLEGATVFHTVEWARVLADSYGHTPVYLHDDSSDGAAVLPLMDVRSIVTGRRGVSLPFTDAVPGLGASGRAMGRMTDAAMACGRERRWRTVHFRGGQPFSTDAKPSSRYLAHTIDLSVSEEDLFARLGSSTRRAIRKAEASGVEATVGRDAGSLRHFCRLNTLTRREHGLPPQPTVFFRSLHRHVFDQGMGFIVTARLEGRAVAASAFLHFGHCAVFKYGASDRREQSARANNLVMWRGILACKRAGCRTLSLGRTDPPNEGLLRFKRGWGAVESKLDYYTYDFRRNALKDDPNRISGIHNAFFRRLPLPLLRLVGTALYRHIA